MTLFLIILSIALVIFLIWFVKSRKKFRFDSLIMINGGVGSGKTSTALYLAIKNHKKAHNIWKRKHIKNKNLEEPLLYSNIPIMNYKYYSPLTLDHILRKKRFNYKSVVFISESSLIANSQDYKNKSIPDLNDNITEFLKLIRHELQGTYRPFLSLTTIPNLIVETQSINDNHFAFDRCITQSLFITKSINIPFFRLCYCRELLLFNNTINEMEEDVRQSNKNLRYIVPKTIFKKYDSTCYSILTDNLEKENRKINVKNIKHKIKFHIPTLHPFNDIIRNNKYLSNVGKFLEYVKED